MCIKKVGYRNLLNPMEGLGEITGIKLLPKFVDHTHLEDGFENFLRTNYFDKLT